MKKEVDCVYCDGRAQLKYKVLKLDNGRIIFRDVPYNLKKGINIRIVPQNRKEFKI